MKARVALAVQLAIMASLIALAVAYPRAVVAVLGARPALYLDVKLAHVMSATLFFGNVVLGTIWEARSLSSRRLDVIRHTYRTVAWLDAFFTAPLILVAVTSGVALGTLSGGVFSTGWLTLALGLVLASGLVWIVFDIPTQARVRRLSASPPPGPAEGEAPEALLRALRVRLRLNLASIAPLLVVFYLMVQKPDLPALQPRRPARASETGHRAAAVGSSAGEAPTAFRSSCVGGARRGREPVTSTARNLRVTLEFQRAWQHFPAIVCTRPPKRSSCRRRARPSRR